MNYCTVLLSWLYVFVKIRWEAYIETPNLYITIVCFILVFAPFVVIWYIGKKVGRDRERKRWEGR